jgi:aldose 1-epimerase
MHRVRSLSAFLVSLTVACSAVQLFDRSSIETEAFGTMPDGTPVEIIRLTNANGIEVRAMTYGAIIVSIRVPDRDGTLDDVVLGFDDLDQYVQGHPQFGTVVGRYANRIAEGRFTLDNETYDLARNNGPNHLHGGNQGFDKMLWQAETGQTDSGVRVTFAHTNPDGHEGYPGNVSVTVSYTLTEKDELVVDYSATTDRATHINLSQHTYFNLSGAGSGTVHDHVLTIDADRYTPFDSTQIPTGSIEPVAGTPLDFRAPLPIGARIDDDHSELHIGGGYDHNFVLNRTGPGLTRAARVEEPESGRILDVYTTEPGMQLYTANGLREMTGKLGRTYDRRGGLCLETQHYPDSPNRPDFPSTILRPGEEFTSQTVFAFSVSQ